MGLVARSPPGLQYKSRGAMTLATGFEQLPSNRMLELPPLRQNGGRSAITQPARRRSIGWLDFQLGGKPRAGATPIFRCSRRSEAVGAAEKCRNQPESGRSI